MIPTPGPALASLWTVNVCLSGTSADAEKGRRVQGQSLARLSLSPGCRRLWLASIVVGGVVAGAMVYVRPGVAGFW